MLLLFEFWYAVITVDDVSNQEGILRDTSQHFLNFKSIRQNRHQKTLTYIREIKNIVEKITTLLIDKNHQHHPFYSLFYFKRQSAPSSLSTLSRIYSSGHVYVFTYL